MKTNLIVCILYTYASFKRHFLINLFVDFLRNMSYNESYEQNVA